MNNIKIKYSPFTEGFLEELRKVKDARVGLELVIVLDIMAELVL